MKFIKLSRKHVDYSSLHIQPMLITCMEPLSKNNTNKTEVHMMDGRSWAVLETVDEIEKLIKQSESFTLTTK